MPTFDEVRARSHAFGFAVYAYDPGGIVTFEVLAPDGQTWRFEGATLVDALADAYPASPAPAPEIEEDVFA